MVGAYYSPLSVVEVVVEVVVRRADEGSVVKKEGGEKQTVKARVAMLISRLATLNYSQWVHNSLLPSSSSNIPSIHHGNHSK